MIRDRITEGKRVHLTSFCKFSTVPGFGRSNDLRHCEKRLKTLVRGERAVVYDDFGVCGTNDGDGSVEASCAGGNAGDAIE